MGISTLHGPHHVAQKLSTTIFPRRSLSLTLAPCASRSVRAAGLPASADALTAAGANAAQSNVRAAASMNRRMVVPPQAIKIKRRAVELFGPSLRSVLHAMAIR